MPDAARVSDQTSHGVPLTPGIGSVDVIIGMMPAWRCLPAGVGGAIEGASKAMDDFMKTPVLTPANSASKIAKISKGLVDSGGKSAAEGNPAGAAAAGGGLAALMSTNIALTATWTAASAVPGGQPAANTAYTEGIKAAAAAAASAVFSAVGGLADTHICPTPVPVPPHGPGMVTKGSDTVLINNLPAARQGDKVMEAAGGADAIAVGCPTVVIGDSGKGSGGGGGGSGGSAKSASAGEDSEAVTSARDLGGSEGGAIEAGTSLSLSVTVECANPTCAEAFKSASDDGTPLVDRDSYGCSGPPVDVVDTGDHWIEFELVGEDDLGVAREPYVATLPDGKEHRGTLGSDGTARIEGMEKPGQVTIKFPRLDKNAVDGTT